MAELTLFPAAPETPECPLCDGDCWHEVHGYIGCLACGDHHRPPQCAVDEQGRALASCGCPWVVLEATPDYRCPHSLP